MIRRTRSMLVLATLTAGFGFGLLSPSGAAAESYLKELDPGAIADDRGWASEGTRSQGDNVAVPEPGTMTLIGLGLASYGVLRRRRRS
jgi:hypothetical protein